MHISRVIILEIVIWKTLEFLSDRRSCMGFRLADSYLVLTHSKGQRVGHAHLDSEYLENRD